jgi:hypothetical protein
MASATSLPAAARSSAASRTGRIAAPVRDDGSTTRRDLPSSKVQACTTSRPESGRSGTYGGRSRRGDDDVGIEPGHDVRSCLGGQLDPNTAVDETPFEEREKAPRQLGAARRALGQKQLTPEPPERSRRTTRARARPHPPPPAAPPARRRDDDAHAPPRRSGCRSRPFPPVRGFTVQAIGVPAW